jgi:hypothetical protein
MKEIHGQMVEVHVYGEIDPAPVFPVGKVLDKLGGANAETLAEIRELQKEHDRKVAEALPPSESDLLFLEEDDFLDTVAENAEMALVEYEEETDETYLDLVELIGDSGE